MFWFGYLASGLVFWIIAGAISLLLAVALFLLRRREWDIKVLIAVAGSLFVVMNFGCCGYWVWCESDFECAKGFGDTFRIPVKYPYEIEAIDSVDEGCLSRWGEANSRVVCSITDYTVESSTMVGKIANTHTSVGCADSEQWFSFNLDTGDLTCYTTSRAFVDASEEFGFAGMPPLASVRDHLEGH